MNVPSTSTQSTLRSALLGAASGLRSQLGTAAVVLGPEGHRVPSVLRTRSARRLVGAMALGELLADKYPGAPNRTDPPSLALRVALGAGASGLLARSEQEPPGPAAAVGAISALGATFAGFLLRRRLSARYGRLVVAVTEDAVAGMLALSAVTWLARPAP